MPTATLGYEDLNIQVTGPETGAPIVLLHGWGSSAALMQTIATGLSDVYRVHNIDLPGHGLSPAPPEPWGILEYAAIVEAYILGSIGTPVTLVGHSNGGRIALFMASDLTAAPLVRRMVLISPSGVRGKRTWKYYVRKTIATTLKTPFQILPGPLRDFGLDWLRHSLVWKMLGSSDYRALQGVMRETFVKLVNFYVEDRLERIKAPTLLFWGDRDDAISRHQMDVLATRIPDAALLVLQGAGHYGYLDQPAPFMRSTRAFLERT